MNFKKLGFALATCAALALSTHSAMAQQVKAPLKVTAHKMHPKHVQHHHRHAVHHRHHHAK